MKILAFESSATAASVCLCEDDMLIAQSFQHTGLTHSQTLLPMAQQLLASAGYRLQDVQLLAVAAGPGSFTGLRIGVSALKGLAWSLELPCAACSSLEAMAWNALGLTGEICAVMDARRGEVYNARFASDGACITRLCEDRAIPLAQLCAQLRATDSRPWLVGDGAALCAQAFAQEGIEARLAPPNLRMQSAWGVARAAFALAQRGETISGAALAPHYLRLSQAERERLERAREEEKQHGST